MLFRSLGYVLYSNEPSFTIDTEPVFNAISAVPLDDDGVLCSDVPDDNNFDHEEMSLSLNLFSNKVESRIPAATSAVQVDSEGNSNSYAAVGFEDSEKGVD